MTVKPLRATLSALVATLILGSLTSAAWGGEKKTVSGTYKIGRVASTTTITPDDVPGHELVQYIRADDLMISADPDFDGVVCTVYEHGDNFKERGTHRAYGNCVHKTGDRSYWHATGGHQVRTLEGNNWEVAVHGTWDWTGGTGKFASLKGAATYNVKITPQGRESKWTGEIEY